MAAVLPYICRCGARFLVSLREPEHEQEDVLANATWGRTVASVASDLGSAYVDRRDTPVFVCSNCETVHTRADRDASVTASSR